MSAKKTKQHISQVAQELFAKLGYEKTTMKLLASEAKVNEATIYRHFGTKENLLEFITSQYVEEIHVIDKVNKIIEKDSQVVIRKLCGWFVDSCINNENVYKIQLKMEDVAGFEKIKLTKNFVNATEYYLSYLKDNKLFEGNPNICANALITSILGILTAFVIDSEFFKKETVKQCVDLQIELFINKYL